MDEYYRAVSIYSAEDNFEGLFDAMVHPSLLGPGCGVAHLFPFSTKIAQALAAAGLASSSAEELAAQFDAFPLMIGMRAGGFTVSSDSLVRFSAIRFRFC